MVDKDLKISKTKIRFIVFLFILGFSGVIVFLFRWQVIDSEQFQVLATERIKNKEIEALRGSIYASNGNTLAFSERRFDIFVYKPEIEKAESYDKQTREEYLSKVSNVLDIDKDDLKKTIDDGPDWVKIASKIDFETKEKLVALKNDTYLAEPLIGHFVEYTSQRIYPENSLASHVVGYLGYDEEGNITGRGGIEYTWEKSLKSIEGFNIEEVDSFGNTITITDFTPVEEQRGTDIYLTIDLEYQSVLEEELKKGVERYQAESGGAVLMDPKTGKILAMANYPTYDPNKYDKVKNAESFNNRSVSVPYEFGSVGKIFTVSGAVEEEAVTVDDVILPNGHNGCEYFLDKNLRECVTGASNCQVCTFDRKPQPKMTVAEGLVKSDNIALYETAKTIGAEGLHKYLAAFGIGIPTSVELTESYGFLKPAEEWNKADLVTYSYGHGYQASLLQVVNGVGAVANDGKLMQPFIIDHVVESDGTVKSVEPKVIKESISKETADIVGRVLNQVYRNNVYEYYYSDLLNYDIAMKSGTALIPYKDRPGYSTDINSTYVGFDLSDEKTFVLGVWLHKPRIGSLSSQNSRVVWIETFKRIKDDLGVPRIYE